MELQDLLEQKAFESLNPEEQKWVLDKMSKLEYEEQRAVILTSQRFFQEEAKIINAPVLNPQNKALLALKAKQNKAKPKGGGWKSIFMYKVAAWQAVAAVLLCFLFFNNYNPNNNSIDSITQTETTVDTVYRYVTQIKEVLQPADTIVKIIYKTLKVESQDRPLLAIADTSEQETSIVEQTNPSREFPNLLQYCSTESSQPASQDTFLQLLSVGF